MNEAQRAWPFQARAMSDPAESRISVVRSLKQAPNLRNPKTHAVSRIFSSVDVPPGAKHPLGCQSHCSKRAVCDGLPQTLVPLCIPTRAGSPMSSNLITQFLAAFRQGYRPQIRRGVDTCLACRQRSSACTARSTSSKYTGSKYMSTCGAGSFCKTAYSSTMRAALATYVVRARSAQNL